MNRPANLRPLLIAGATGFLSLGLIGMWVWPEKVPFLAQRMADQTRQRNRERWYHASHQPPPTLLQIKTAAEDGQVAAQMTLAEVYVSEQDFAHAVTWYRKAAEQGWTNAQVALGQMLLQGRNETPTSTAIPRDADEALLWLGRAANQGNVPAQLELGGCYVRGTGVEPNLIEAYKWFALADPRSNAVAQVALEHLQLQMSRGDTAAGQQAATAFVPSKNADLPEHSYLAQLRLKGISPSAKKPLAIVNNRTLGESEEAFITLYGKTVKIRCLKIEAASVLVQVGPFRKQLRLSN